MFLSNNPGQKGLNFHGTCSTHCGLMTPYGERDLVNIGSGNGLLPDVCPMQCWLTGSYQWDPAKITWGQFYNHFENYLSKLSFKSPRGQWVGYYLYRAWPRTRLIRVNALRPGEVYMHKLVNIQSKYKENGISEIYFEKLSAQFLSICSGLISSNWTFSNWWKKAEKFLHSWSDK